MKKTVLFLITSIVFCFQLFTTQTFAEDIYALGQLTDYETMNLDGLNYEYFAFRQDNGDLQKVYHASFNPKQSNYEMVVADNFFPGIYRRSKVYDIAVKYEKETGRKVIAAFNGDFFNMGTGEPVGSYVKENNVYRVSSRNGFGFNNEGEVQVGPLEVDSNLLKLVIKNGTETREFFIDKINETPSNGEIAIYYDSLAPIEMSSSNVGKYLVRVNSIGEINYSYPILGEPYRLTQGMKQTSDPMTVHKGYVGIEVNNQELLDYFYDEYTFCNTTVEIVEVTTGKFTNIDYYVGGGKQLVVDNVLLPESYNPESSHDMGTHPRTTIGITKSGEFFISVIDGRNPEHSQGITIPEQADLAVDLGAQTAIELDGGGSSSFVLRINDVLTTMNEPSDGQLRGVSNAVLIVEKESTTTDLMSTSSCYPTEDETYSKHENIDEKGYILGYLSLSIGLILISTIIIKRK